MKKTVKALARILFICFISALASFLTVCFSYAAEIDFEWDANTERDLAGYKIYSGNTSRFDPNLKPAEILTNLQNTCESNASYTPENLQECKDTWAAFCADGDKLCDKDYYTYDSVVDVGNVTTYKMENVTDGEWFFAAVAYDTSGNESKFSDELSMVINNSSPGTPLSFKATIKASKVIIETD